MENESRHRTKLSDIIYFYRQQIERFKKIGIGNRTEFGTMITEGLINITLKRLNELQYNRDLIIHKGRSNGIK